MNGILPSSQMLEQARQLQAYTGPDKTSRTYYRDKGGNIAVIRGNVNPSIRLHTLTKGWTVTALCPWAVTSLTPLEQSAVNSGHPIMEIKSEGMKPLRENDHWDASLNIIGWVHGAVLIQS
jgi:hypothetical protein